MGNYETWGIQAYHQSRETLKLDSFRRVNKKEPHNQQTNDTFGGQEDNLAKG